MFWKSFYDDDIQPEIQVAPREIIIDKKITHGRKHNYRWSISFSFSIGHLFSTHCALNYNDWRPLWPGGTQRFLGGCVPHGFPKVGSRERIFLEKGKMRGLGNKNLENLRLESWNFYWPQQRWRCTIFLKTENRGHMSGALMINWYARERRLAWKKRIITAEYPHTTFQCEYPPGSMEVFLPSPKWKSFSVHNNQTIKVEYWKRRKSFDR